MTIDQLNAPSEPTRAQATSAQNSLAEFNKCKVQGVMVISESRSGETDYRQLRPTKAASAALDVVLQRSVASITNNELIDYGPATLAADGQVMWIAVNKVPGLSELIQESDDLAGLPLFDPKQSKLSNIRFVGMTAQVNGKDATFIEYLRGRQVIAQTEKLGVLIRKGVLDVPSPGQLALIGQNVSVVVIDDVAFFEDRKSFQAMFGYLAELRAKAEITFTAITANLRIRGIEEMKKAATGSLPMLGKMASIQKKIDGIQQYRDALTMPKLVAFIERHPECEVAVLGVGEETELVYQNDVRNRFKILKLLDDDYLHSELTDLGYEANSKGSPIESSG